ncbi:hypothetical protein NX794_15050 [Streptomyces sp. LP11]|uniref:Uncharacterized protein n=1 Tax=Streptomyces pyxinicus TaxID=2970331 RepID=A0ABT2B221_9ACTN|nr:hypothetical protein [Streptomyces sp. LP11]MCS0602519.1 hypothetical protein [Streptomyces sp. LP11]
MTERPSDDPFSQTPSEARYEPAPSLGKFALWIALFLVAALAVVLGGIYFT